VHSGDASRSSLRSAHIVSPLKGGPGVDAILDGFMRRFRQEHDLLGLPEDKLFETFAAYCVIRKFHENDFEPDHFRMGGPGDLGIDAAAVSLSGTLFTDPLELKDAIAEDTHLDVHFIVVQARTSPAFAGATFTTLGSNLEQIFTDKPLALQCSQQVKRFRACVDAVYADKGKFQKGLPKLSVFYVATGNPNQKALEPYRGQASRRLFNTGWFGTVDMHAVGATELRALYHQAHEGVKASITITKYLPLPPMQGIQQAYLGVVPARHFVDNLLTNESGQIRRSLFHDNVRGFQQMRNPVNRAIQDTVQDPDRRGRFAIMNNGITIVARGLVVVGEEFQLRDFQIVNGCQTCHVLFYERDQLVDATQLTVRIIVTQDADAVGDVVEATNRQTAVPMSAFDTRSPFHKELEDYFVAQLPPRQLLYERRSGQFGVTGKVADDLVPAAGPAGMGIQRTRIIQPRQLARAFESMFMGEVWRNSSPGEVRSAAIFRVTTDVLPYYTAAATLYRVQYLLRNRRIPSPFVPARFHLMAAAKYRLVGDSPMPGSAPKRADMCNTMLDCMWDDRAAEELFDVLVGMLIAARNAIRPDGDPEFDSSLLEDKAFADKICDLAIGT
jgi:hypothetical protein